MVLKLIAILRSIFSGLQPETPAFTKGRSSEGGEKAAFFFLCQVDGSCRGEAHYDLLTPLSAIINKEISCHNMP